MNSPAVVEKEDIGPEKASFLEASLNILMRIRILRPDESFHAFPTSSLFTHINLPVNAVSGNAH